MSLPEGNRCPTNMFDKSLEDIGYSYVKYITCLKCQNPLENELCVQDSCSKRGLNAKGEDSSTFCVIKLLPELESLIMGKPKIYRYFLLEKKNTIKFVYHQSSVLIG